MKNENSNGTPLDAVLLLPSSGSWLPEREANLCKGLHHRGRQRDSDTYRRQMGVDGNE